MVALDELRQNRISAAAFQTELSFTLEVFRLKVKNKEEVINILGLEENVSILTDSLMSEAFIIVILYVVFQEWQSVSSHLYELKNHERPKLDVFCKYI